MIGALVFQVISDGYASVRSDVPALIDVMLLSSSVVLPSVGMMCGVHSTLNRAPVKCRVSNELHHVVAFLHQALN